MTSIERALKAAAALGPGPLAAYAVHRLKLATGWLRIRTPGRAWSAWALADLLEPSVPGSPEAYALFRSERSFPRFFFDGSAPRLPIPARQARSSADAILRGSLVKFTGSAPRPGFPPQAWNVVVGPSGETRWIPSDRHWSTYDLGRLGVDARLLWEPSRFGWVLPLARAFRATRDLRYAEGFWRLWESWADENPPNAGVQWASGQEVALRLLALVVALYAFAPAWRKRPGRVAALAQAVLIHARRIPPTLGYARAQGNNHVLSEAAGLYTAGVLFPEARDAARWRHTGRRLFVEGLQRQVFADGGYIQHSTNYHRLALQLGLWMARLGSVNEDPLTREAIALLGRLTRGLANFVDASTGGAVHFGPDDGSDLFAFDPDLTVDSRPTLQAASRLFLGEPLLASGPWDELAVWLGIPSASKSRARRMKKAGRSERAVAPIMPDAGLVRLNGRNTWGCMRAAHFRSRPGHSDQLHVDLWWRGRNVALDPGSYLYQAPAPWEGGFGEAGLHNTLTVDGADPMERAGPFLWLDWAQAELLGQWNSAGGSIQAAAAEHHGYRSIIHRRTLVRAGESWWIVADDLLGPGRHRATAGWNLPDLPWSSRGGTIRLRSRRGEIGLSVEGGTVSIYRAGKCVKGEPPPEASPRWGWRSGTYGRMEPALRVVFEQEGPLPMRIVSRFELGGGRQAEPKIEWMPPGKGPAAVARVRLGKTTLEIAEA
ncbi:MAG TPA: alginate lyase family protein [Anaerolineales bacterium]|nr:alginate lyase family protein [Anaerolineales bacterium]